MSVLVLLAGLAASASVPHESLTLRTQLLRLPLCAHQVLSAGAQFGIERHDPAEGVSRQLSVDYAYVLHYRGNLHREAAQRAQMPLLGLPFGLVVGYDAHDITEGVQSCIFHNLSAAGQVYDCSEAERFLSSTNSRTDRRRVHCTPMNLTLTMSMLSASLKLHVALYDMLVRSYQRVLVLEDNVKVVFSVLPRLEAALNGSAWVPGLSNFSILFSGSYDPKGGASDPLQGRGDVPRIKEPGVRGSGIMPAIGEVISTRGAVHILRSLPIVAPIDFTLSDARSAAGRQRGQYYLKPYAFIPDKSLQAERMGLHAQRGGEGN